MRAGQVRPLERAPLLAGGHSGGLGEQTVQGGAGQMQVLTASSLQSLVSQKNVKPNGEQRSKR